MMGITSVSRKQLISFGVLILLIIAIPITMFLARQTQIFKPKAFDNNSTLRFLGANGQEINSTNVPNVGLRITYAGQSNPSPPPSVSPSVPPSPPASPAGPASLRATYASGTSRLEWNNLPNAALTGLNAYYGVIYLVYSNGTERNLSYQEAPACAFSISGSSGSCNLIIGLIPAEGYRFRVKNFKQTSGGSPRMEEIVTSNTIQ